MHPDDLISALGNQSGRIYVGKGPMQDDGRYNLTNACSYKRSGAAVMWEDGYFLMRDAVIMVKRPLRDRPHDQAGRNLWTRLKNWKHTCSRFLTRR